MSLPDWDVESGKQKVAIPAEVFLNHVANLHCEDNDGDDPSGGRKLKVLIFNLQDSAGSSRN